MATNFISSFGLPPGGPGATSADTGPAARDSDEGTTHSDDSKQAKVRIPKGKNTAGMSDAEIVSQIERYRNEAFMREYIIRNNWLDAYGQYRNKQDFDDKAPWQSRITFPKAHAAIKNYVAQIMRLLLQAEQWTTVEPGEAGEKAAMLVPLVEHTVLKLCGTAHFRSQFRDACEYGGIIGLGVLKVGWAYKNVYDIEGDRRKQAKQSDESQAVGGDDTGPVVIQKTRKQGTLYIQSIDPFHIWFGPRTRDNNRFDFVIEETLVDVDELKAQGGLENTDELEHVDRITDQMYFADQVYTRDFARYDKRQIPAEHYRKQCLLWEFWGDIVDPHTQRVIAANKHILIGNRTTILKYEDNPYWDGLPPYIIFSPLTVAGRFPGQGLLEMNMSVKDAIDRVAQKQEDHLSFSVVPMLEVQAQALENPEGDMQTGVQPGKVFYTRSGAQPGAVQGVQFPQLSNSSFNMQMEMNKEYQRGTFITDQAMGMLDVKGETTATEVQNTQLQSTLLLSDIAQTIEDACLNFVAEKVWWRAFQFMDATTSPTWEEIIGPLGKVIDQLSPDVRVQILNSKFTFKAQGLSRAIERQQNLSKYKDLMGSFAQLGGIETLQTIGLNMPAFFRRMYDAYHLPRPWELVDPQAEAIQEEQRQSQLLQNNPFAQAQATAASGMAIEREKGDQQTIQKLLDMAMQMHAGQGQANPAAPQQQPQEQSAPAVPTQ